MCQPRSDSQADEPPMVSVASEKPTTTSAKQITNSRKKANLIWAGVIVTLVIVTCTVIVIAVGINVQKKQYKTIDNQTKPVAEAVTSDPLKIVTRDKWNSLPRNNKIPQLKSPVKFVIICHTAGRFCNTFNKCSAVIKWIQKNTIQTLKKPDIFYNFIAGGDGNLYEGRGWTQQNTIMDNSITISLIGNYIYDVLTEIMINEIKKFLAQSIEAGFLDTNYILVAHNQTQNTQSPGLNAYREIQNWTHYTSDYITK